MYSMDRVKALAELKRGSPYQQPPQYTFPQPKQADVANKYGPPPPQAQSPSRTPTQSKQQNMSGPSVQQGPPAGHSSWQQYVQQRSNVAGKYASPPPPKKEPPKSRGRERG